ncbi:armadillo-type protein [Mycena rosella]|uniref:Armadillo-type protein n=1 Tax=Mycena rosella TaxID=1033263 RepID=A0AAD7CX23_MYCRO|nr:armadillo-type protein [Mycena rosella]
MQSYTSRSANSPPSMTSQASPQSLHSRWSDSHPVGATMSLHTAAKPVMKFMYHRQVLALVARTQANHLSEETMEIYSSYLAFKYVSHSTKTVLLKDLYERALSEGDTSAVVKSLRLQSVKELLGSPDALVRSSTCWMLGRLAYHGTAACATAMSALAVEISRWLVFLLRDTDSVGLQSAIYALSGMIIWPNGAQAAVDANILDYFKELLESSNVGVRKFTCWLLGGLARQKSAVLGVTLCVRLVSLLRDDDVEVIKTAMVEIWRISLRPQGARAVLDANVLHSFPGLLESPRGEVRKWACNILGALVRHDMVEGDVLAVQSCNQVVYLLRDESPNVAESAAYALFQITRGAMGVQAVLKANVLNRIPEELGCSNTQVRKWTSRILEGLGQQGTIPTAALAVKQIVLQPKMNIELSGRPPTRIEAPALIQPSMFSAPLLSTGMLALTRQRTPESVHSWWTDNNPAGATISLLESVKPLIKLLYHRQALNFMKHNRGIPLSAEATEVYSSYLGYRLVSRWTKTAILRELYERAASENEAHGVVNVLRLNVIEELLGSVDAKVRRATCWLLGKLASHEAVVVDILTALTPCPRLVSLLRDEHLKVIWSAADALSRISRTPKGAEAVVDANVLDDIPGLFESPDMQVRKSGCEMVGELTRHPSTATGVIDANLCLYLVSLLRDKSLEVIESAAGALVWMAEQSHGAKAAVDANALECLRELLESQHAQIRKCACWVLGRLAVQETTAMAVLSAAPCSGLIALLRDVNVEVAENAACALWEINQSPDGAQACLNAEIRHCTVGSSHTSDMQGGQRREISRFSIACPSCGTVLTDVEPRPMFYGEAGSQENEPRGSILTVDADF